MARTKDPLVEEALMHLQCAANYTGAVREADPIGKLTEWLNGGAGGPIDTGGLIRTLIQIEGSAQAFLALWTVATPAQRRKIERVWRGKR